MLLCPVKVAVGLLAGTFVQNVHGPPLVEAQMSYEATPEGGEPASDPVTETGNVRAAWRVLRGTTMLVGGVTSMSHEVATELVPALPFESGCRSALTVRVYSPLFAVKPANPPIW